MASVVISDNLAKVPSRNFLNDVNLSDTVEVFRSKVSKALGYSCEKFDLVYCGRRMEDNKKVEVYGVKPGVTVHILPRAQTDSVPETMDSVAVSQVVTALQTALLNPAYRNTVERLLHDPEALKNIVSATPGLSTDPIALAILQDPEMLAILADPAYVETVIQDHPALGHAVMLVATAVTEEGAKDAGTAGMSSRGAYSLDQMSDDEDMEGGSVRGRPGMMMGITASQLAAALAAAGAPASQGEASSSSSNGGESSSNPTPSGITADFFRQAIAQATQQSEEQMLQSHLAQMRDMGITDEAVARQALQVTGGDLQAAIELLFGDANL